MTPEERKLGLLAFSAMTVSGTLAYEAARSLREGDLLKTEARGEVGGGVGTFLFATLGVGLTFKAMGELADEVGVAPLALGAATIFAAGAVLKKRSRK